MACQGRAGAWCVSFDEENKQYLPGPPLFFIAGDEVFEFFETA